ncbi:TetR family transcriptional regulator [Acrocarpospora corrugata]|uniref:TetR family transcriptional regulator n=1 Tax=Acrocarpospora corrugata TaxID=35763 RepID=A0A5M3VWY4_9ACTN|nr:TetR family transcriptional regulator [Acrocarpospora corrugata]GES00944.1 TetR family transcriptional regulator [Acrocarpospora corrugata]
MFWANPQLRLAVEHGLDGVTVEAIADAANISRRTFSNYFASKEDAVLYGEQQRIQALVQRLRARPGTESAWTALRGAIGDFLHDLGEPQRDWVARTRLARRHPSLLARQLADHAGLERELAHAIAERDGGADADLRPRVMAAAFLAALRVSTHVWVEESQSRPLSEIMSAALDEISGAFR